MTNRDAWPRSKYPVFNLSENEIKTTTTKNMILQTLFHTKNGYKSPYKFKLLQPFDFIIRAVIKE